jgi:hypothetical protein
MMGAIPTNDTLQGLEQENCSLITTTNTNDSVGGIDTRDGIIGRACNHQPLLELEIKHKHGGFNINYEKATVVWQRFGFGS